MSEIVAETCNRCGAEVSGPDAKDVKAAMNRHRKAKRHLIKGTTKTKQSADGS